MIMENFEKITVSAGSAEVDVYVAGPEGATCVLFLHGGVPGASPYASGAHIWGDCLNEFARERRVAVLDLPSMATGRWSPDMFMAETNAALGLAALDAIGVRSAHVVGHDTGGITGMTLVMDAPERISSISIVASPMNAPTGDTIAGVSLTSPPLPILGDECQRWAFNRLGYSHPALFETIIGQSIEAAKTTYYKAVGDFGGRKIAEMAVANFRKVQYRQWEVARTRGIPVPVQIVWSANDPRSTIEIGRTFFGLIAEKQQATQFHVINRAGAFPFLDQPEMFTSIVSAFLDGVTEEKRHLSK